MAADERLDALLRRWIVPDPPADLTARVLRAAAPLLAHHAAGAPGGAPVGAPDWALVARALLAAVLCLPATIAFDVALVQGLYRVLGVVLPAPLGAWVAVQYAAVLVVLLGLALAAVPIVAGRAPLVPEESHA